MKKCVHIIIRDKFTNGYIKYFLENSFGWKHVFFTFAGSYKLDVKSNSLYVVKDYNQILKEYRNLLDDCDKIVVAAFFDEAFALLKMPTALWNKTYIQFWGGDIYRFRQQRNGIVAKCKQLIAKELTRMAIIKANGVLTLVDKDYEAIEKIFHVSDINHRVVQVPDDFYEINHLDYNACIDKKYTGKKRILVGNSATIENRHLEIFGYLATIIDSETEVLVPLSYGDMDYQKQVIEQGKKMLKDSFVPAVDFMPREKYINLLSTCDVAIFNNDRQQATGNIILLANLGKKIYMRNDTSMWLFFKELGFAMHTIEELKGNSIEELLNNSPDERDNNYMSLKSMEEEATEQWRLFLNDKR